jgi:AcrR family transcriptional regulator
MSAGALLERALAAPEPDTDATAERILDAALELAAATGLRHVTMDKAAARAGVGRMTVYRRFGDRQSLIDALAAREARRCIAELDRAVDPGLPAAEGIAQGFVASLALIREHPLLQRFARHEPETALAALNAENGAIVALSREFVAARIRDAQDRGEVASDIDAGQAGELIARLGFSFLLLPESVVPLDDPGAAAESARRLIAPILSGGQGPLGTR